MIGRRTLALAASLLSLLMIFTFFAPQLTAQQKSEEETIKEINRMIQEKGYHWTAGKTSVSGLSLTRTSTGV